jgi:hypothetical protein
MRTGRSSFWTCWSRRSGAFGRRVSGDCASVSSHSGIDLGAYVFETCARPPDGGVSFLLSRTGNNEVSSECKCDSFSSGDFPARRSRLRKLPRFPLRGAENAVFGVSHLKFAITTMKYQFIQATSQRRCVGRPSRRSGETT